MKTFVDPDNAGSAADGDSIVVRGGRSIGTILIQAGRLSLEDAERILQLQHEQGGRFGDAGIKLGLLTQADIDFALSCQFGHTYLVRGNSPVSESIVSAYAPNSPQAHVVGALRSQLMLRWFDNEPDVKALAIISAERGEGRSYVAANLAVAFSQLGQRALLIDADLRNPSQHTLFGLDNRDGLSAILSGRGGLESAIQPIDGLNNLSVLPSGPLPPNPLELLARPQFITLLQDLSSDFDAILLDSPASSDFADAQTIAVRAGAALIVARKNASRMWKVRGVSDAVNHASAVVIGTVLNDF